MCFLGGAASMYRAMIVEDSKPIVRNLKQLIQSFDSEISVEAVAYDGGSAWEIMGKIKNLDILFTDIKLPIMDGLTLAQRAKELYPQLKCVVISGYDDFEFMHKALILQIDEYILKPVDPDNFYLVLAKLIQALDRLKNTNLEAILSCVVQKNSKIAEEAILPKSYFLTVIRSGLIRKLAEPLETDEIYKAMGLVGSDGARWVIETPFLCEKIVLFDAGRFVDEAARAQNAKIRQALAERVQQLNMIYSGKLSGIGRLYEQYTALSNNLSSIMHLGQSSLYDNTVPFEFDSLAKINDASGTLRKRMEFIIKSKGLPSFKSELHKNICEWKKNDYQAVFIRKFLLTIFDEIANSFPLHEGSLLYDNEGEVDQVLNRCRNFEDLENEICAYYGGFLAGSGEKAKSPKEYAKKIEEYLRFNIYKNITLRDIAAEFCVSPSYVSRLMKVYYQNSPMDYYNKLRMEEARQLIAKHPDMLVREVAEMLGFGDQHYFSKAFKSNFGVSPALFKNSLEG
jgi:Response regulator containing CheY-like receiver domain and AraC-type DNA-binding domain